MSKTGRTFQSNHAAYWVTNDVDVTPRGGKERALLALLVLNRGRVIDADRLIDELWTDLPVDRARHAAQALNTPREPLNYHRS